MLTDGARQATRTTCVALALSTALGPSPFSVGAEAEVQVSAGRLTGAKATPAFEVGELPRPWKDDAAAKSSVALLHGREDPNSRIERLTDGKLPAMHDAPSENFFLGQKVPGGRLLIDLGRPVRVAEVNTFPWHRDARGPQVYTLYAADGSARGFNPKPGPDADPAKAGWTLLARVDTRPGAKPDGDDPATPLGVNDEKGEHESGAKSDSKAKADADAEPAPAAQPAMGAADDGGGQYAVSIAARQENGGGASPVLGRYRYLLFDIRRTRLHVEWDNTFFSEIDVVDADNLPADPSVPAPNTRGDRPDPNGL